MDAVGEDGCCEKYLRIIGRKFQRRGEELTEGTIREFKVGDNGWKGETKVVGGASFTSRFDIEKIYQQVWYW